LIERKEDGREGEEEEEREGKTVAKKAPSFSLVVAIEDKSTRSSTQTWLADTS